VSVQFLIAGLIAAGIPLVFLFVIYTLDLYASRTFRLVLACFGWGAVGGVGLSFLFNQHVALSLIFKWRWDILLLYVVFAPVAEEIFKSLSIFYVARRPEFTYFVDGAIYGFAAGIGFSIVENFLYISQNPYQGVATALVRAFSVCLMHGTAAGLVGAAVGKFRFRRGRSRGLASLVGWIAAILLHALFNAISQANLVSDSLVTPLLVAIGLLGVGLIAYFIIQGLHEERQWFAETLDRKVGVSSAEVRAAQAFGDIDQVLEEFAKIFPAVAEQIEELVLKQAQLGIKRKVLKELVDPKLEARLEEEISAMQAEMETLRKEIGPYAMAYVRAVFPEGAFDVWGRLEGLVAKDDPADLQRWSTMLTTADEAPAEAAPPDTSKQPEDDAPARNIFASLQ
jgi:RsiW-degrading membrane proteinase PrsW (M82 family)